MNLYEIKEKLKESKKAVFNTNEIARISGTKKNIAAVYVNRMLKKNILFRVERGKASTTKDIFIIASQLIYPSYISFITSLYLHGYVSQIINNIYIVTTKKRKDSEILQTKIKFVKLNSRMLFGYDKIEKENSFIFLANLEKTIIDCLYSQKYCRVGYLIEALKNADIKKIEEYANIINIEAVNRRLGYLLDFIGKKHSLTRKTKASYKLNPTIKNKGKFNNKWYLYVNEELK